MFSSGNSGQACPSLTARCLSSTTLNRFGSPLLLLSDSALEDFADTPSNDPNAVIVGLAPDKLDYGNLNAAFRLLTRENVSEKDAKPALVATHRALYFRDADQGLSLGPGMHSTYLHTDSLGDLTYRSAGHVQAASLQLSSRHAT